MIKFDSSVVHRFFYRAVPQNEIVKIFAWLCGLVFRVVEEKLSPDLAGVGEERSIEAGDLSDPYWSISPTAIVSGCPTARPRPRVP